jgi:hypothetical protein
MALYGSDEWGKSDMRAINRIAAENEKLISGEGGTTEVSPTDDDVQDIYEHKGALDLLRMQDNPDPQAIMRVTEHIMKHVESLQQKDPMLAKLLGQPDPPVMPGNPAFMFAQQLQQAQMMLNPQPQPMPGDPNAPPANDQQKKPAPKGAQPEAAA